MVFIGDSYEVEEGSGRRNSERFLIYLLRFQKLMEVSLND